MNKLENLEQLPMTQLETYLKRILEQRPDVQNKILTAQELGEYIEWLAETFGNQYHLEPDSLPSFAATSDMNNLVSRFMADPQDKDALIQLAAGYTEQSEERYISASRDIAIARMFRYMPSHWHTNKYFEIYYAFSGDCPIYFLDEVIIAKQGTVLIVAPSVVHASPCYNDDCSLLYCLVRTSTFDRVFWNNLPPQNLMSNFFRQALSGGQSTSYVQFDTGIDPDVRRLLLSLYEEYQTGGAYSSQMLNVLLSAFFVLILRRYEGTARLPRTENFFWKHEFSAIFSYIQMHYTHTSLQEVAARFNYSERQISRIILKCTGKNYAQLILQLRMEKAASLLRQRELSIKNISEAVGYSTTSSFYRTFTSYYGCPPNTYIQKAGKCEGN